MAADDGRVTPADAWARAGAELRRGASGTTRAGLRRTQIGVSDIGLRRPTLDDAFLQLTGAPPGAAAAAPAAAGRAVGHHRHRRGHRPQPAPRHPPAGEVML